jgi:hypothetical protein
LGIPKLHWKIFLMFILVLIYGGSGSSLTAEITELPVDTSFIWQIRQPTEMQIDSLKQLDEFQYGTGAKKTSGFLAWLMEWLRQIMGKVFPVFSLPFWVHYVFFSLLGILLVYKIFTTRGKPVYHASLASQVMDCAIISEDIHNLPFDELIAAAQASKDFRKAIRFLYLKLIKQLHDKGLLVFKREKSNRDYIHELGGLPVMPAFIELTNIYEWVWYGQFGISEEFFTGMRTRFENAKQGLDET